MRQELARVALVLAEEFERALAGKTSQHARSARLLKLVLFGSYARGEQVIDPVGGYWSDFDILAVVNHEELTDLPEYWQVAEERLLREMEAGGPVRTPVNLLVHSMADLNGRLRRGRPFFVDIVRDGILLLDTPGHPFEPARPLSPEAARSEAQGFFDEWFGDAGKFLAAALFMRGEEAPKLAAFDLHQATERL